MPLYTKFYLTAFRDIVDTEDANGNVWKMLLGSFDDYWDGDSEENLLEIDLEKRG